MRACLVVVAIVASASLARADAEVTGFVAVGTGELAGTVLDLHSGKPLASVKVHVVPEGGAEQIVVSDRNGIYRAKLPGGTHAIVFVEARVRLEGRMTIVAGDTISTREALPPTQAPLPKDPDLVPRYSDLAFDHNDWARAWLMLDIDPKGAVQRVKLINKPGFGLDRIAIEAALKLRFEPARDPSNRAVRSLLLWTFEWPAYWWMRDHAASIRRLPRAVNDVPCRGSGPSRSTVYRDCAKPDMMKAITEPWTDR